MVLADALARSLLGQQKSTRRWEAPEVSNFYIFLKSFCKIIRPFDFFADLATNPRGARRPGLLVQLQSSGCGVRLVARVRQRVRRVDLPTPSITHRLWCLHRRRRPCNLVGRTWLPSARAGELRASWRLLWPTARAGELRTSWRLLCPTAHPWQLRGPDCGPPIAPGNREPPGCVPAPS
jgi:hypothetical protein